MHLPVRTATALLGMGVLGATPLIAMTQGVSPELALRTSTLRGIETVSYNSPAGINPAQVVSTVTESSTHPGAHVYVTHEQLLTGGVTPPAASTVQVAVFLRRPTPAPTATVSVYASPTPDPTPVPTPVPVTTYPPGSIQAIIVAAADRYGVSPTWMIGIAECESGLRPTAINPTGPYEGLFQFLPSTFAANGGTDIWSPYQQANITADMLAHGQAWQWSCA